MKVSGFFHRLVCALLVCLLLLPVANAETVDLKSMTNDEIIDLLTRVNEEIVNRGINKTATLPQGTYYAGSDIPAGKYISYAADGDNQWIQGIKNNIHVSTSTDHMDEGLHTVRIYGMHAGFVLERLAISSKALKSSYLGPEETFMLDYDIVPEQKNGVNHETGAGELSYGALSEDEKAALIDPSDTHDPADEYEEEVAIPSPVTPTPEPENPNTDNPNNTPTADNTSNQAPKPTMEPDKFGSSKADEALKKGATYKVGNFRYKITKLVKKSGKVSGGNVSLVKVLKKKAKAVIPATVKIKKLVFKVTAIGKNAFKNNKKLQRIQIQTCIPNKCAKLVVI